MKPLEEKLAERKQERAGILARKRARKKRAQNLKDCRKYYAKKRRERIKEKKFWGKPAYTPIRRKYPQNPLHPWGTKKDGTPRAKSGRKLGVSVPGSSPWKYRTPYKRAYLNLKKRPGCKNHYERTRKNPLGGGKPRKKMTQKHIKTQIEQSEQILKLADKISGINLDNLHEIDGFYSEHSNAYSPEDKLMTVAAYIVQGSVAKAATFTGITRTTVQSWKQSNWWAAIAGMIQRERHDYLDSKLTGIQEKALDIVDDSLEYGNRKLDKEGNEKRIPLTATEAMVIAEKAVNNQSKLKEPVVTQVTDDLNDLRAEFKRMAQSNVVHEVPQGNK